MSKNVAINTVKGHTYIRVCESYRNEQGQPRSRTVRSYGRLDLALAKDPLFVEKLREQVAKENRLERELKEQKLAEDAQARIRKMEAALNNAEPDYRHVQSLNIGTALIRAVWKDLNMPQLFRYLQSKTQIEYPYEKTSFLLVADRFLNPASKLRTYERKGNHIVDFSDVDQLNDVYRVLDRLHEDKKNIVRHLNREIGKRLNRTITAAFYDVTTYAFESRQSGELRNFGMSKDCKVSEVQVVLGLVMDADGIPLDYELFPGNTSEFKTMLPIIRRLKKTYNLEKLIVVADRGLNSNENLQGLMDIGCDFILAQKVKNCTSDQKEFILSEENWEKFTLNDDGEVLCKFKQLDLKKPLFETKISASGRKYSTTKVIKELDVTWMVSFSQKRANKDIYELERAIEKAEAMLKTPSKLNQSKGFKSLIQIPKGKEAPSLRTDKIQEARKWAGYYAVCTNLKGRTPEEIMGIYRQLWKIEDCFRVSKSDLEARPCFVWKDQRIHGHFAMCYIALVLEKYMEHVLKKSLGSEVTTTKMIEAMRAAELGYDDSNPAAPVYHRLYPYGLFDEMLKHFNLEPPCRFEEKRSLVRKFRMKDLAPVCAT